MASLGTIPEIAPRKSVPLRRWLHPFLHPAERRWSSLLVLALLCGFLFFYGLNAGEVYRTEGLRAIIAAEFLRSGNWIVPTLYGEPLFTKPPGMYAAIALCSLPFGQVTDWSARLPSAIAATATVFLFYWYFGRQLGRRAGLIAAVMLPISLMWLDKAPSAEIDLLQVAWVTGAILFFLRALDSSSLGNALARGSRLNEWVFTLLSLLCVTGGFLTKWTAPGFFYFTILPLLWWRGQLRLLLGWPHLVSLAVAVGLCLAWVAAAVSLTGWEIFYNTVSREALMRISPRHHPQSYPWGETLAQPFVILATNLPFSIFALLTLRPGFTKQWDERGQKLLQALHCWAWPNLLFWTVIPEHAVRHSTPLFPALSGLAAMVFIQRLEVFPSPLSPVLGGEGVRGKEYRAPSTGDPVAEYSVPGTLYSKYVTPHPPPLSPEYRGEGGKRRWRNLLFGLVVAWLVVKVVFVQAILPMRTHNREARARGEQLAALVPADATLHLFKVKDEGIMFYYGRPVRRLADPVDLTSSGEPMYCILTALEWSQWDMSRPATVIAWLRDQQGDSMVLVRVGGGPR